MKIATHRLQFHSLRENSRAEAGDANKHVKVDKEMINVSLKNEMRPHHLNDSYELTRPHLHSST